jgi:transketolase
MANVNRRGLFDIFRDRLDGLQQQIEDKVVETVDEVLIGSSSKEGSSEAKPQPSHKSSPTTRSVRPLKRSQNIDFDKYLRQVDDQDIDQYNHIQLERIQARYDSDLEDLEEKYEVALENLKHEMEQKRAELIKWQADQMRKYVETAKAGRKISY